jgi:hypothetical protein
MQRRKKNGLRAVNRIKCQARTKSAEPCKARATPNGLCSIHADPGRAAELGRISGEAFWGG